MRKERAWEKKRDRPIEAILTGSKESPNWQGKLETLLAEYGIIIKTVWRNKGDPTKDVVGDVVFVTSDCCSHTLFEAAKIAAGIAGIPLIVITHRKSATTPILERMGFRKRQ